MVADAVGADGRVILTDFSPEMVEAARRNGEARGAGNVEYRVLDAEKMDLEDDCVDGATCRWGYMLMADPGAALKETRRVVRDGGPLAFAVWTSPDRNPWVAFPGMTLVQRASCRRPDPDAPGMFALGDQAASASSSRRAGFGDPEVEEIRFEFRYPDEDYFWETLVRLAGGVSTAIAELDDDEREAARVAVVDAMADFRQDDGSYAVPRPAGACSRAELRSPRPSQGRPHVSEHSEERDPAAQGEQNEEKQLLEDIDPTDEESSDVKGGIRAMSLSTRLPLKGIGDLTAAPIKPIGPLQ